MCPPGLGFASVSQRALDAAAERRGGRYYFDWGRTAKGQRKDAPSPFTPAVTLFLGLDVALELIEEEGSRTSWPATTCSPGPPAPARRRSGSSSSATRTSARPS